jgi:hypothetical protein
VVAVNLNGTDYLLEAKKSLHSAFKFTHLWGYHSDRVYAAQHAHAGILNALKALALHHGLTFEHEVTLMEMMSVFWDHDKRFLKDRGIHELTLVNACYWSLLNIYFGQEPPDKALLLEAISVAEKIISECKQP